MKTIIIVFAVVVIGGAMHLYKKESRIKNNIANARDRAKNKAKKLADEYQSDMCDAEDCLQELLSDFEDASDKEDRSTILDRIVDIFKTIDRIEAEFNEKLNSINVERDLTIYMSTTPQGLRNA